MKYDVIAVPNFRKELKKLTKKYPTLREEYFALVVGLETNPEQGIPLGKNCFKIRLAIKSKGKGKRGGARVITNILVDNTTVYLLSIFDKSDKDNITDKELSELLASLYL